MSLRPAIFISAVSPELKSARQLVADTLRFLGYEPEWRDIPGSKEVDLRAELRRRIDSCSGVVQLVGECYGPEPPGSDHQFGRTSYTQYEALYAASKGKKVWYLFLDEGFPTEAYEAEDEEKRQLQSDYRTRVKADSHLYHSLSSKEALEAGILKLRDDLTRTRRGVRHWAAVVAGLVIVSVGVSVWLLHNQQHSNRQLQVLQEKFGKLQEGVNSFAEVQNKVRQEQPHRKPEELEQRTYEELGKQLGIDPAKLKEELPRFAQELKKAPKASAYERANAAYVEKDYDDAERVALVVADEAESATPAKIAEAIKAFELAGWAAEKRIEYADALKHLREAEKLTDRSRDVLEWARVQSTIAFVLFDQGQYRDDERVLREVLVEREHNLGPEHHLTLETRQSLATALFYQGKYTEAEMEDRPILSLRERVLGPEDPDTLSTRTNLANALYFEGKYAEAEAEYRAVIKLREKVLGPEHSDTLSARNNLANALDDQGKFSEAETEYRAVIRLKEKVLGPEHPETLRSRYNLAIVLYHQRAYAEAETEFRALIRLREKTLGPEHPDTLTTRIGLAVVLNHEAKYAEAETEDRGTRKLEEKVLGPEHPFTLGTRANIANALDYQGKYPEAETEYRAVLKVRERVLGPEHLDLLETRNGLAEVLDHERKYVEAETEYRTVLKLREKVLGVEHPDTLRTCFDLAVCLHNENQIQEASAFAQRAADGARKVLGPDHPDTKKYEKLQQELLAKDG